MKNTPGKTLFANLSNFSAPLVDDVRKPAFSRIRRILVGCRKLYVILYKLQYHVPVSHAIGLMRLLA